MFIVIRGNLVEGQTFHGPFPDRDEAAAWDDKRGGGGFVVTLKLAGTAAGIGLPDYDYVVVDDGLWLTVGNWSCRVSRRGEHGAKAAFYPIDNEDLGPPTGAVEV